jgi:hypothetical protein
MLEKKESRLKQRVVDVRAALVEARKGLRLAATARQRRLAAASRSRSRSGRSSSSSSSGSDASSAVADHLPSSASAAPASSAEAAPVVGAARGRGRGRGGRTWRRHEECPAGRCRRCHYEHLEVAGGPSHAKGSTCRLGCPAETCQACWNELLGLDRSALHQPEHSCLT